MVPLEFTCQLITKTSKPGACLVLLCVVGAVVWVGGVVALVACVGRFRW